MPLPPVYLHLCLSLYRHLSPCTSCTSYQACCRVTSCHAAASRLPAPSPFIALPPLIMTLLRLFSGWLLCHHLLSHSHLLFACALISHCTATSHHVPLAPLDWLVVASPLITLPPPIHLCLYLMLRPSCASFLAGCHITSCHAAVAARPPVLPPLIAPPPLIMPLSPLLSGWLLRHLLSCRHLLSTCSSASHHTAAFHRTPVAPLFWLAVTSPLVMLPPPVCLQLRLSLHRPLSLRPPCASFLAGCCVASHHANVWNMLHILLLLVKLGRERREQSAIIS
jgi:hypothetical protein